MNNSLTQILFSCTITINTWHYFCFKDDVINGNLAHCLVIRERLIKHFSTTCKTVIKSWVLLAPQNCRKFDKLQHTNWNKICLGKSNQLTFIKQKVFISFTYFSKNSLAGEPLADELSSSSFEFGGQSVVSTVSHSKSISAMSSPPLDVWHCRLFCSRESAPTLFPFWLIVGQISLLLSVEK